MRSLQYNTGHCNVHCAESFKSHNIYPSNPVKTLITFQIKRILIICTDMYRHSMGNFTCPKVGPDNTKSLCIDHSFGYPFIEAYIACIVCLLSHYKGVIMGTIASQITSLTIVYSTVHSRRWSKKTSKLRVTGFCAGNSPGIPHKWPVTWNMFPFDDVIIPIHCIHFTSVIDIHTPQVMLKYITTPVATEVHVCVDALWSHAATLGPDKMANILQTIFAHIFIWINFTVYVWTSIYWYYHYYQLNEWCTYPCRWKCKFIVSKWHAKIRKYA